jgi:GDP-4-dehydro-6-deoxy-D-mannose reductase
VDGPLLVTGAAGFAGSHLVDQLVARQMRVVALDRPGVERPEREALPTDRRGLVTWVAVDLLDRPRVAEVVAAHRPRIVFHCAGAAHVGRAWRDMASALEANVLCTHHVIEAVRQAHLDARLVVIGSALVYRPSSEPLGEGHPIGPAGPYGVSKLAQELLAIEAAHDGLDVVVARSFNHIGPRQQPDFATSSFARQIALAEAGQIGPVLRVGNLDARRDVTDVRDTVRAYQRLAERGAAGQAYNVCSGRAPSVGELLEHLRTLASIALEIQEDPALLRPVDQPILIGDGRRIREATGWEPSIPLDQSLRDLLDYWRSTIASA